ncbi:L-threonylcarbamoyladenylate synthase [Tepidibacter formicigenes]|jgi:L-threonylcarbamoyladenylate synthase|uniref:Threonylcarbamoyl-AMP synthase n=1 Tax=Tepidibacter formicigenes DSM 15518 TaxID=1123349 RepID=A0A1M6MQ65_9FIRM|nr:L-threonylcarbamoyladenylate synthase [Tepidibacter formicigenes]SHJ85607.1 L-threonylcarbamoyladenylate synthase [Tepidibacter formicigenes DSM 15518]
MKKTLVCKIDKDNIDIKKIKEFAHILRNGGTVIFPTETVYGLGANALDEEASKKIYEAKGRPSDNPLIVHIADKEDINKLATNINERAKKVIDRFWPGPITIVLKKKDIVPSTTSGGLDTVAVRMPSHPIALRLIKESGVVVAAPSANISGRPSPTDEENVLEEMNGRVDGIILGGDCNVGLESTVLDLTGDIPMILRPGGVTLEDLNEVLGNVIIDPAILKKNKNIVAKAPGMKYTHYSPKASVYIVSGEKDNVINKINSLVNDGKERGQKIGVMCINENISKYKGEVIGLGEDLNEVAFNLFKVLREMDKRNVDVIYSETFENNGIGQAVMNRLTKAAGYKIIQA